MAQDCTKLENLHEAALLVIANAQLLRDWVNGNETASVTLGGRLTPSIRKLVADIDARESAAASRVIETGKKGVQQLLREGTQSLSDMITAAASEADRAERAADMAEVCSGCSGAEVCWMLEEDIPVGGTLTFPAGFFYLHGRHHLHCSVEGAFIAPCHYAETGSMSGEKCTSIIIGFALKAGERFHAWVSPLGSGSGEAMALQLAELTALVQAQQASLVALQEAVAALGGGTASAGIPLSAVGVDEAMPDAVTLTFNSFSGGAELTEDEVSFFPNNP